MLWVSKIENYFPINQRELLHLSAFESPTKSSKDFHSFQLSAIMTHFYWAFMEEPLCWCGIWAFYFRLSPSRTHTCTKQPNNGVKWKNIALSDRLRKKIQEEQDKNLMIFADRIVASSSEMIHTHRDIPRLLLCGAVHQSEAQHSIVYSQVK